MSGKKFDYRIPQEVIDDLIARNDIVETISRHLKIRKEGKDYVALCPFHKESTPSFSISPSKQFYYCYGCGASGNTMVFLQEYGSRSFLSTIMEMADDSGVDLSPYLKVAQGDNLEHQITPALNDASHYFQSQLQGNHKGPSSLDYLKSRGVPEEIQKRFKLGHAGFGPDILEALQAHQDTLILTGLFGEKDGRIYSQFRDRLILPIHDVRGKMIGLSGRTLTDDKPKYMNTKETSLFSRNTVLYGLHESLAQQGKTVLDHLYVVEGQFDVIGCHMLGKAAGAGLGSSLSLHQLRLILRHSKHSTFVFDGDAAGKKAALKVCSLLIEHLTDFEATFDVALLEQNDDPFSLAIKGANAFEAAVSNTIPWLDAFFILTPGYDQINTDQGRSRFTALAIEVIHEARDPLIRHQALEKLANLTAIPLDVLNERLSNLPLSRSGQSIKVEVSNDASIRFARMVWDEPQWAESVAYPEVWKRDDDPLVMALGIWIEQMRLGLYDADLSDKEQALLSEDPKNENKVKLSRRSRGAALALGRMITQLPSQYMQNIMAKEPETVEGVAVGMAWHITGQCAAKEMQEITRKTALGILTDEDRELFMQLKNIRQKAIVRTRTMSQ